MQTTINATQIAHEIKNYLACTWSAAMKLAHAKVRAIKAVWNAKKIEYTNDKGESLVRYAMPYVPSQEPKTDRKRCPLTVCYWDVEKEAIRCFRIDRLVKIG